MTTTCKSAIPPGNLFRRNEVITRILSVAVKTEFKGKYEAVAEKNLFEFSLNSRGCCVRCNLQSIYLISDLMSLQAPECMDKNG